MGTKREVLVGDRMIGDGHPVFVIAEIGINHNGSLDIAKKIIEVYNSKKVPPFSKNILNCEENAIKIEELYNSLI